MKEPKNGEVQLFESACAGWVHVTYYRALEEVRAPSASSLPLSLSRCFLRILLCSAVNDGDEGLFPQRVVAKKPCSPPMPSDSYLP
jgi:hypothetical protein